MDKQFLEFWKNAFINVANGIQQFESFAQWMSQGMTGGRDITDQFRKAYGLDRLPEASDENKFLWERAVKDFLASYQVFMDGMGLVPKEKYTALLKKCEAQEATIAGQKDELYRLRLQLQAEKTEESVKGLVRLMESQADQFQKAMDAMGTLMGQGKTKKA